MQVHVYCGDYCLATAECALWPDDHPRNGALTMPRKENWLSLPSLILVTADGTRYSILPKREEHTAGERPVLVFDIE